jgi:P22_AR N-terminal domain
MHEIMTTNFHGAQLYGEVIDTVVYVALKPISDAMGLSWHGQLERAKRDPILREGIRVIRIPFERGGTQSAVGLQLKYVNGWLFKIESRRIKDLAVRERVQIYQRECYEVLYRHFSDERDRLVKEANETMSLNLRLCTESRHIHGAYAAAQLWDKLGLPKVPAMDQVLRQGSLFDWDNQKAA